MNNFGKNLALWVIIGLLLIALFNLFQGPTTRGPQTSLAFSDFLSEVQSGRVTDVVIQGDSISGHFQDYGPFPGRALVLDLSSGGRAWGPPSEFAALRRSARGNARTGPLLSWYRRCPR